MGGGAQRGGAESSVCVAKAAGLFGALEAMVHLEVMVTFVTLSLWRCPAGRHRLREGNVGAFGVGTC